MSRRISFCLLMVSVLGFVLPNAMAQRPEGIDVSHWDGDLTSTAWSQIYNAGYQFCWAKATEGVNFTDSTLHNNMSRGAAAGVYMGVYHFARPTWNTATAEAQYCVQVAGQYMTGGYMRPVLDLEDGSSLGATALSNWANAFINEVVRLTGVEPLIYTNTNYATYYLNSTVANRTLWIAQYFTNPNPQTQTPSIGVFNSWAFWQWGDNGQPPGTTGSTDMDVHNGTSATLANYLIPGGTIPPFVVESRSGGLNYSSYSETGTWSSATVKSTAAGVTAGIGSRWCTIDGTAKTAVFRFTPSNTGSYQVYTTNCNTTNSGNPLIHKVTHTGGTTNVSVCQNSTCNPTAVNTWYSLGTFTLNSGTQYSVTLDGATTGGSGPSGNAGRSDAIKWVYMGASGPTITAQPVARNICSGTSTTFSVTASGSGTLSYQWQKNSANLANGGHYSGATTATLTVSSADSNDVANYRCVVTDSNGSTTSNQAGLTLKSATAITTHPTNKSVAAGGSTTFTVAATGSGTLSYQWQKNSVNLSNGGHYSGVTTATLTITSADSGDAATYRCVVTGDCGSATSNGATLTVTGGGVTVLIDDPFDAYAAQTNFTAAWPISTSPGGTLSTAAYYSSPKSISIGTGAARNYRNFTATVASDATPIVWTYRLYDNNTTALDRQWCELLDASPSITQLVAMGKSNINETMRTYYAARVAYAPGPGWIALDGAGAPTRSVGWHELKAVIKSTTIDFYVDGVLAKSGVAYSSMAGTFSFDQARLGSGYSSTSAAYYDNYKVQSGQ